MEKTGLIEHTNLSEKAYEILKNQIINQELKPGERLLDDKLASSFGISRTPVREALTRLSNEGLVEVIPRSGIYVKKLTKKDVQEIYEIRVVLEALAAKKATPLISDNDLNKISKFLEEAKLSLNKGGEETCLKFDVVFHNTVLKNSQNERLYSIMNKLNTLIHTFRVRVSRVGKRRGEALEEHEIILTAMKERDAEKAEEAMREHIKKSMSYVFSDLEFYYSW